jgi:purine-nucleoside phosphorylase
VKSPPNQVAAWLRSRTSLRPQLALVLGSGFQPVLSRFDRDLEIPYHRLSGFPAVGVPGHEGILIVGHWEEVPVLVLSGRAHYYEGHSCETITFPIRVLAELGIRSVLLTNAVGAINRRFRVGDFVRVTDHINWMGVNPLRGVSREGPDPFLDLGQTYDPALNELLCRAARRSRLPLHRGIYLAVSGPTYETPAEIRAFARLGADVVGMSLVPEAIVARHCGMTVAGLSCVTNRAAGLSRSALSHDQVLRCLKQRQEQAGALVTGFIRLYAQTAVQAGGRRQL